MRYRATELSRRTMMAGTCGAACAAALSACSTYSEAGGPPPTAAQPPPGSGGGAAGSGGGAALTPTADIPVGGGKVFEDAGVVVTQPEAGQFRAFSAVCTHQGCNVDTVENGQIACPCHGSTFAVADGAVIDGPATSPLEERQIEVAGEAIRLA